MSLPFVRCPLDEDDYEELMMAVDHRRPGHDHLNDGICAAKHSMMVMVVMMVLMIATEWVISYQGPTGTKTRPRHDFFDIQPLVIKF